jgi:predicted DNA-binding transcriptional regulator YafY
MANAAGRLLELLSLLQTPRDWPGTELAARLEVSPRTIRRDVERLRDLGYPVEATLGVIGGYRLVGGTAMPPLLLDDEEAVAIAVGLRTVVGHGVGGSDGASIRALTKLQQVLPPRLRARVAEVAAATRILRWDSAVIEPEGLTDLSRAIANRTRVRFDYTAADTTSAVRTVEPYGLVAAGRTWYLLGWDIDRDDWRTFRVDRLSDLRPMRGSFVPRAVPMGDVATFVRHRIEASAPTYPAVALVHAPAAEVRRRLPTGTAIEPVDDTTTRVRLGADTLDFLAFALTRLDADFVIEEPLALRHFVGRLARKLPAAADGDVAANRARAGPRDDRATRRGASRCCRTRRGSGP